MRCLAFKDQIHNIDEPVRDMYIDFGAEYISQFEASILNMQWRRSSHEMDIISFFHCP